MGNLSCTNSSWTSSLWDRDLRVFMTRTMAASICKHSQETGWEPLNTAARRSDHEQEPRDMGRMGDWVLPPGGEISKDSAWTDEARQYSSDFSNLLATAQSGRTSSAPAPSSPRHA